MSKSIGFQRSCLMGHDKNAVVESVAVKEVNLVTSSQKWSLEEFIFHRFMLKYLQQLKDEIADVSTEMESMDVLDDRYVHSLFW